MTTPIVNSRFFIEYPESISADNSRNFESSNISSIGLQILSQEQEIQHNHPTKIRKFIRKFIRKRKLTLNSNEFIKLIKSHDRSFFENTRIIVTDNLNLSDYENLESLPNNLTVKGNMNLSHCKRLKKLPDNLTVKGDLILSHCKRLKKLPNALRVIGNLILSHCKTLTFYQKNIYLPNTLNLSHCDNLRKLPEFVFLEGDLDLSGCWNLKTMPKMLKIGGDLNLSGCRNLKRLPHSITKLGHRSDGSIRIINLTGSGLSNRAIHRLQTTSHEGIRFVFSQIQFSNINQALIFWEHLINNNILEHSPQIRDFDNNEDIIRFLSRLVSTKEYENENSRQFLAKRILDVFRSMASDSRVKELALFLINDGLTSCHDRIISAFDKIELMINIHEIEKKCSSEAELREEGKRYLFLEMVKNEAKKHVESNTDIDEVEVYLAFQIVLADSLNLPIKIRNMIFRRFANIRTKEIERIGVQIKRSFTEEKLDTFLNTWSPWKNFQKRNSIPSYEDLLVNDEVQLDDDITCPITQDTPEQPVTYKGTVYDYKAFIQQYLCSGMNPMDPSEKINLLYLKKVII